MASLLVSLPWHPSAIPALDRAASDEPEFSLESCSREQCLHVFSDVGEWL
jgi:hypothetical protein